MHPVLYLFIACLLTFKADTVATGTEQRQPSNAIQSNDPQVEVQEVTLFSRIGHKETEYGKSAFSFKHGLRSDNERWLSVTHNDEDLLYGSLSINGDSDWFCVSMGGENPSKIKDIGALEWSDIHTVPVLLATPPTSTGIRHPNSGESYEESSEQRVTKVVAGHMYIVHVKDRESDHYAMFRIEKLTPSDSCTITWKLVPSPESEQNAH